MRMIINRELDSVIDYIVDDIINDKSKYYGLLDIGIMDMLVNHLKMVLEENPLVLDYVVRNRDYQQLIKTRVGLSDDN